MRILRAAGQQRTAICRARIVQSVDARRRLTMEQTAEPQEKCGRDEQSFQWTVKFHEVIF